MSSLPFKSKLIPIAISQALLAQGALAAPFTTVSLADGDSFTEVQVGSDTVEVLSPDNFGGQDDAGIEVTLGNSSSVTTSATANGAYGKGALPTNRTARSTAVYAESLDGGGDVTVTLNNGSSISSSASAADADGAAYAEKYSAHSYSKGIDADNYSGKGGDDARTTIELSGATINVDSDASANGFSYAESKAIDSRNYSNYDSSSSNQVNINDSTLTVSASAVSKEGGSARTSTGVIDISSESKYENSTNTVTLTNSTLNTENTENTENTTSDTIYASATAVHQRSYSESGEANNTTTLSGSTINQNTTVTPLTGESTNINIDQDGIDIVSNTKYSESGDNKNTVTLSDSAIDQRITVSAGSVSNTNVNASNGAIELESSNYSGTEAVTSNSVTLNNSDLTQQTNLSTGDGDSNELYSESSAIIVDGYSEYAGKGGPGGYVSTNGINTITLNNSLISQQSKLTAGSGDNSELSSYAEAITVQPQSNSPVVSAVTKLNNSSIEQTAVLSNNGGDDAEQDVHLGGIYSNSKYSNNYGEGVSDETATSTQSMVELNTASVIQTSTLTLGQGDELDADSNLQAIFSSATSKYGNSASIVNLNADSKIQQQTTITAADGNDIDLDSRQDAINNFGFSSGYGDSFVVVSLNDSVIEQTANLTTGSGEDLDLDADSEGINSFNYSEGGDFIHLVELNNSDIIQASTLTTGANTTDTDLESDHDAIDFEAVFVRGEENLLEAANTVSLSNSAIAQSAQHTLGSGDENNSDIFLRAIDVDTGNYAETANDVTSTTTVSLDNSSISQSTSHTIGAGNYTDVETYITAVDVDTDGNYNNDSIVSLTDSQITIDSAMTIDGGNYIDVSHYAEGVVASFDADGDLNTSTVTLNNSTIALSSDIALGSVSNSYAENSLKGMYIESYADGDNGDGANATTVSINNSQLSTLINTTSTGREVAEGEYNYSENTADAASLDIQAEGRISNTVKVTIDQTTINDSVTIDSAGQYADAEAEPVDIRADSYGNTDVNVTITNSEINANTAVVFKSAEPTEDDYNEGYGNSDIELIDISADSRSELADGSERSRAELTISDTTLNATATINDKGGNGESDANIDIIEFDADGKYASSEAVISLNNVTATANASARSAGGTDNSYVTATVDGIDVDAYTYTYGEGDIDTTSSINLTLSDTTINIAAEATIDSNVFNEVTASADGIRAESSNQWDRESININLDNADIIVAATSSTSANNTAEFTTEAYGIVVNSTNSVIDLTSSSIDASASTSSTNEEQQAMASAILVESGDATISLSGTTLTASATNGQAFGIYGTPDVIGDYETYYGAGDLTINLDADSAINAPTAVFASGSLNNAGTIYGLINIDTVNNSGFISGHTIAQQLTVSGFQQGTAEVDELTVTADGTISSSLSADTVPTEANFQVAQTAALADGATVDVEFTGFSLSYFFNEYLVLEAGELDATQDNLALVDGFALLDAVWSDSFGDNTLAVSFEVADFSQYANTNNGKLAANALRSRLVEYLSEIEPSADAQVQSAVSVSSASVAAPQGLYDFLIEVNQANHWDQLIDSANGDNIAALSESDRVVGNYIQRQLAGSTGLNSGDEASVRNGLWVQGLYSKGEQDRNGENPGFDSDTTAIALGYGRDLNDNLTIGAGITYSETEVDGHTAGQSLESDYVSLLAYGQYQHQDWFANAVISYGLASNDDERRVASEQLSSSYDSDSFSIRAQVGHDFGFNNGIVLSPRGEFRYNYMSVDGYQEQGGTFAALEVDSQSYDVVEFGAGLNLAKAYDTQYGLFTPHLDAGIYYDTKGDNVQMSSRFIAGGPGFVVEGEEPDQTSFTTTAGVDWDMNDQHSLRLDYQYFGNGDFSSNSLMAKYHYAF
ncbi:hypothetical protein SIN8267_01427 [Sinobacterium norvegicum]|uniref:Autotransporter domain-containing protein n=1 Tax=Sinobacterium norvegicum TaxID=1641715 RepID=A0ABN8EH68_9GAMM|nr:autotransporter outer membrane beta-barrel domain-containing protein [Sinobacterium norvegicum]CAH0991324.1 hypothetical protein SIN8267_01427 [Sinobacterium norvegicum]